MKHLVAVFLALLSLNAFSQIPDYVPTDGLVGWYPFNANASNEVNPAAEFVVEGAISTFDRFGYPENAYSFDGIDDEIIVTNPGVSGTGISLSFWYQSSQLDGNAYLIALGGTEWGSYFEVLNNHWSAQTSGPCYGPALSAGGSLISRGSDLFPDSSTWHHCAIVLPDGALSLNDVQFYLDGLLVNSTCSFANYGAPEPNVALSANILFGAGLQDQGAWSTRFQGAMDDVGFWNRALDPEEILMLFETNALVTGCTDSLACNFDPAANLDDGSCIAFSIEVPLSCNAGNVLECSANVNVSNVIEPESIDGYELIGSYFGSMYYLSQQTHNTPSGWEEQQNLAESLGGHLVDILSLEENDAIVQMLEDFGWPGEIWLGLSDDDNEGNWTWSSGEPVVFTNWYPNEPNNCGGGCGQSNWGQLYTTGQWDDFGIAAKHCIIELPLLPTVNWSNGDQGLTASYPDSITSISANLVVDGIQVCTAFQDVIVGQGCNDPDACNYNENDGCNVSCLYVLDGGECEVAASSLCGEGTIWDNASQTCIVANPSDSNFDGCVQLSDLLDLLSAYGTCEWQCGHPMSYQGYDYETVLIGEQCWFAENARYMPFISGGFQSETPSISVYGYSGHSISEAKSTNNYISFGALYNFVAVEEVAICPTGWHVPTKEEFDILFEELGGLEVAHLSMMAMENWNLDFVSTDLGFNVLPAGWLYNSFQSLEEAAFIWTSSSYGENDPRRFEWNIQSENNFIITYEGASQAAGKSVRCVKDAE